MNSMASFGPGGRGGPAAGRGGRGRRGGRGAPPGPPKLPGEWVQCPYDPFHWPQKHRFLKHLMGCRKAAGGNECTKIRVCEFTYAHHIPAEDYEAHLLVCPKRPPPDLEEDEDQKAKKMKVSNQEDEEDPKDKKTAE